MRPFLNFKLSILTSVFLICTCTCIYILLFFLGCSVNQFPDSIICEQDIKTVDLGRYKETVIDKIEADTTSKPLETISVESSSTQDTEISEVTKPQDSSKIKTGNENNSNMTQETLDIKNDEIIFSFIVYGDSRPADDSLPQRDVFLNLVQIMKEQKTPFLISTGDVINGVTSNKEIIVRQFTDYINALNIFPNINFIFCGNHDIANDTSRKYFLEMINKKVFNEVSAIGAQVFIPSIDNFYSDKAVVKYLGDPNSFYYFFKYNGIYFIILNAYEKGYWGAVKSNQLIWLEKTVARLKDEKVFVYIHAPVYSVLNPDNINDGSKHVAFSSKKNQDYIKELFKVYKIDGVFSGHEHLYNRQTHDGTEYIITALSGEYPYLPEEEGGFYHFCRIDIKEDCWILNVIDSSGKIRDYEEIDFN